MSSKKRGRDAPQKAPQFGKKMRTTFPQSRTKSIALRSKETGYVDLAAASYNGNTTGSIVLVATIPQGNSVNARVGKKIQYKSIQIRGNVTSDATTTTARASWFLVYDKRPTGSVPAITEILDSINSQSFTNDSNSGRFKILRRENYALSGNSAAPAACQASYFVDEYVKLNNLPAVFKAATSGAIADYEEGPIYLVTVGDIAAGTADVVVNLGFRTRFWDV